MLGVVAFTVCFKVPDIKRNYPYMNYIDEGHIVRHSQNMYKASSVRPHIYLYGSAMMNMINLVVMTRLIFADDREQFKSDIKVYPQGYYEHIFTNDVESEYSIVYPPLFLVAGRVIVLFFFILSIFLLYLLSSNFLPPVFSVLPSMLLATTPILSEYSVYVHNDIPMLCLFLTVILCAVKWQKSRKNYLIIIASFMSGVSVGMKYTGMLFLVFTMLYVIFSDEYIKRKIFLMILSCFCLILGFYFSSPGLFGFERDVLKSFLEYNAFYSSQSGSHFGYLKAFFVYKDIGQILSLFGFLGLFVLPIFSKSNQRKFFLVSLTWTILFLALFFRYEFQPTRNMFPFLPLLVLSAVILVFKFLTLLPVKFIESYISIFFLIFVFTLQYKSLRNREISVQKEDSRIAMSQFFKKNELYNYELYFLPQIALNPIDRFILKDKLNVESRELVYKNSSEKLVFATKAKSVVAIPEFDIESLNKSIIYQLENLGLKKVSSIGSKSVNSKPFYYRPNNIRIDLYSFPANELDFISTSSPKLN